MTLSSLICGCFSGLSKCLGAGLDTCIASRCRSLPCTCIRHAGLRHRSAATLPALVAERLYFNIQKDRRRINATDLTRRPNISFLLQQNHPSSGKQESLKEGLVSPRSLPSIPPTPGTGTPRKNRRLQRGLEAARSTSKHAGRSWGG